MAEERIDIAITDKVAPSIARKIIGIADASDRADSSVARLKANLAGINASGLNKLSSATSALNNDLVRHAQLQARVEAEQSKAALAAQRLATETAKTAAAQARAEMAAQRLATANERVAASASRVTAAQRAANQRAFTEFQGIRTTPTNRAIDSAAVFANAVPPPELAQRMQQAEQAADRLSGGLNRAGRSAQLGRQHMMNLGFQLQDIFVSLQAGQNPLTVFVQQGGQIGQIAAQSGVGLGGMARALGQVALRFAPIALGVAAVAGGLGLLTREINKTAGANVQMTDVVLGAWDALKQYLSNVLTAAFEYFGTTAGEVYSWLMDATKRAVNTLIGAWSIAPRFILSTWQTWPAALGDLFFSGVNLAVDAINFLIRKSIDGLNFFIQQANTVLDRFGGGFSQLSAPQLSRVGNPNAGGMAAFGSATAQVGLDTVNRDYVGEAAAFLSPFAQRRARQREAAEAAARNRGRAGGGGGNRGAGEQVNRAAELARVNAELSREVELNNMLQPQREIARRVDAIANDLRQKRITLTAEELAQVRQLAQRVEESNRVAAEMDRIYQAVQGPQQRYNDTVTATNRLLAQNAISQAEATRQINLAREAREEALNPMRQQERALRDETERLQEYGRNLEVTTLLQERYNAAVAAGQIADSEEARGNFMLDQGNQNSARRLADERNVNSIVSPIVEDVTANARVLESARAVYAEIERLRQQDVLSEQQAAQAKAQFDEMVLRARLARTQSFLGTLAELQNSNSKKLRAIGKAAAIAQASIDTYVAANKALAAYPPPFNFIAAAAVVAAGIANVAKIAGFERGGYTGNVGRKEVAGVVHGQEFVVNAAATAKNRPLLEAMNRGEGVYAGGYERGGFVASPTAAYGETASVSATQTRNYVNRGRGGDVKFEYVIDARGAETGVDERIAAVLEAQRPAIVQQARQAALEDVAEMARRQRIGGGF